MFVQIQNLKKKKKVMVVNSMSSSSAIIWVNVHVRNWGGDTVLCWMPFGQFLLICLVIFILVELLSFSNVWDEYLPFGSVLIPITVLSTSQHPCPSKMIICRFHKTHGSAVSSIGSTLYNKSKYRGWGRILPTIKFCEFSRSHLIWMETCLSCTMPPRSEEVSPYDIQE